jgi:hypothetical protein
MKPTVNVPKTKIPPRKGGPRPQAKGKRKLAKKTKPLAAAPNEESPGILGEGIPREGVAPVVPAASAPPEEREDQEPRAAPYEPQLDRDLSTRTGPPSLSRQLRRQLTRRLRPTVQKSRVLKFGIMGVTVMRETLGAARRAIHAYRTGSKTKG